MGGRDVRPGIRRLNEAGVATHSTPEQAVRAFMHLVSYAHNLEGLYETPRDIPVRFDLNRRKLRQKLAPLLSQTASGTLSEHQAAGDAEGVPDPLRGVRDRAFRRGGRADRRPGLAFPSS